MNVPWQLQDLGAPTSALSSARELKSCQLGSAISLSLKLQKNDNLAILVQGSKQHLFEASTESYKFIHKAG
jgi:hypothetical protein